MDTAKMARQSVHNGRECVLTVNGKPFVKVSPPEQVTHHLGAGKKFSTGKAVRHDAIPESEWKGTR